MTFNLLRFGVYPVAHFEVMSFEAAGFQTALLYVERRQWGGWMVEVLYLNAILRAMRRH